MKEITRRAAAVFAALLLLTADSWITWRLAGKSASRADSAPAYSEAVRDPISAFRTQREQLRARLEAQLNDIIHSQASDPEIISGAQRQLMDILSRAEAEGAIEGILQSRGFEGALASVSPGSANVLVRRETLTAAESAIILDLVMRETGLTGGNVKIIPVK